MKVVFSTPSQREPVGINPSTTSVPRVGDAVFLEKPDETKTGYIVRAVHWIYATAPKTMEPLIVRVIMEPWG